VNLLQRAELIDHVVAATHQRRDHAGPAVACPVCHNHAVAVVDGTLTAHKVGVPLIRPRPVVDPDTELETVGWQELAEQAGLTYRILDYWSRKGWLCAVNADPGSGSVRRWPIHEVAVAQRMKRLTDVGLEPEPAHRIARAGGALELAPGVRVEAVAA
jgi:hypothetical protein